MEEFEQLRQRALDTIELTGAENVELISFWVEMDEEESFDFVTKHISECEDENTLKAFIKQFS